MSNTHQTGWLVSEWDSRDPKSDIADIECGKYLAALETLPEAMRQMLEDGDMHCQVEEVEGRYRITKIVAKRDPEFIQGTEKTFIIDKTGRQIPIPEEDLDRLLGIETNPDDVLASDEVEIVSIDSEYTTPRDVWDVVFDATEYIQQAQHTLQSLEDITYALKDAEEDPLFSPLLLNALSKRYKMIKAIANSIPTIMADNLIYSADWFPKRADKRFISNQSKKIACRISTEDLTKQQVGKLIGKARPDQRPEKLRVLKKDAEGLSPSKEKAVLMKKVMKLTDEISKDKMKSIYASNIEIPVADIKKLWNLWQQRQMELHGSIKLQPWQFKTRYNAKLLKLVADGIITKEVAKERLAEAMERIYYQQNVKLSAGYQEAILDYNDLPDYLIRKNIPIKEECEDTMIVENCDLMLLLETYPENQQETIFEFSNNEEEY